MRKGIFFVCSPPPPSLVGAYYLHPPDARAIFLHSNLLCNGTCSVTGGRITYWGAQTKKNPRKTICLESVLHARCQCSIIIQGPTRWCDHMRELSVESDVTDLVLFYSSLLGPRELNCPGWTISLNSGYLLTFLICSLSTIRSLNTHHIIQMKNWVEINNAMMKVF